jgi:putative ABC transport system permease protein
MTAAFETNLHALGLLALFVGVFLVYNTVTFSVVQRRGLWASLRTLGVTRAQVFRLVCGEALALGAVGTALGLGLGTLLGSGLVRLVAQTINDLYFSVGVSGLSLEAVVLTRGLLLGLGGTLLGAIPPALEATSQAPRTAQARSTLESRARALVPRLALAGVAVALLALLLLAVTRESLVASFVALFALLLAAAFLAPAFTVAACALAARTLGPLAGSVGRMAARGIVRNLSRNAVAIAALSIAIAASVGMGVMIASFRDAVSRWLTTSLVADVYVSAPNPVSSRNTSDLPPGLVERFLARPGVEGGTTYRGFVTTDPQGETVFGAALGMDPRSRNAFAFAPGWPDDVWERFEAGQAIVSEPFSRRTGLGVDDTVELVTDRGLQAFTIAGVYYDYTSDQGFVQVSRATYERWYDDRGVSSLALFVSSGTDPQATAEALRADLRPGEVPRIRSTGSLREASLELFDRTFRVTAVLRLLAGAVAFVGTLSALLALQLERGREVGVLRALGLTPRQVRRLVLSETGLMGAIAGLLALPLGAVLAWVLIEHINTRAFGWTLWMQLHASVLLQGLALAVVAALLAGVFPAWRMARISPAEALRSE